MHPLSLIRQDENDKREWLRYEASNEIELPLVLNGKDYICLLRDISLGGARLTCDADLPGDQALIVNHPVAGRITAQRRWRRDKEFGVTFDFSESALDLVSQCIAAMGTPPPAEAQNIAEFP